MASVTGTRHGHSPGPTSRHTRVSDSLAFTLRFPNVNLCLQPCFGQD